MYIKYSISCLKCSKCFSHLEKKSKLLPVVYRLNMLLPQPGSWLSSPSHTILQAHWPALCSSDISLFPHLCFVLCPAFSNSRTSHDGSLLSFRSPWRLFWKPSLKEHFPLSRFFFTSLSVNITWIISFIYLCFYKDRKCVCLVSHSLTVPLPPWNLPNAQIFPQPAGCILGWAQTNPEYKILIRPLHNM